MEIKTFVVCWAEDEYGYVKRDYYEAKTRAGAKKQARAEHGAHILIDYVDVVESSTFASLVADNID